MIIYISGPITGRSQAECEMKFNRAEREINAKGHDAINPWKIGKLLPVTFDHEDYMKVDMAIIRRCDAVYFMDDWELSKGCRAEREYCVDRGSTRKKKVFDSIDKIPEAKNVYPC